MAKLDESSKEDLLALPQVVGVGYGYKTVRGVQTDQEGIVVLVSRKLPPQQLAIHEFVPKTVNGIVTDVVEVGELKALEVLEVESVEPLQERTEKVRPAPPGVSIGHYLITAGTFGAVVYDNSTAQPMILSNNHVLANATNGHDGRAEINDPICQPGPLDFGFGDIQPYIIARLKKIVSLADSPDINVVDCALGEPLENSLIIPDILEIGQVQGFAAPILNMDVKKSGRTTGLTFGQITVLDAMVDVNYGSGRILRFDHQIITTNMSSGGDSGSLLLDENNMAVGLLFAGSSTITVHNPIQDVLDLLSVAFQRRSQKTTGILENTAVGGMRPTATIMLGITNNGLINDWVQISGFYVEGASKVQYVSELINLVPGEVRITSYYADFDAFEFQFLIDNNSLEISVWGKDIDNNLNPAHRLLPLELDTIS
jgi:hypothetical protein